MSRGTAIDCANSGSTAVVGLLQGQELTTAWVGDSRAIVGSRVSSGSGWVARDLSKDHKPDDDAEFLRITGRGGRVMSSRNGRGQPVGPARVWLPHADYPGLAMSRALGDLVARPVGVVPVPDIRTEQLSRQDGFLVFASDGVWEFLSSQEVASL
ncbi:protein phosphatase 2C-like protein, partial [Haematococcus lacustris]